MPRGADNPTGEGFERFKTAVADEFVPLRMSTPDVKSFEGHTRSRSVGSVQVTEVAASHGMVQHRTPRLIRQHAPELLKVNIVRRGRCAFVQDGRQASLTTGDYVFYDTTKPYEFHSVGGFALYGVIIPREKLPLSHRHITHLMGQRFSDRDGLASLVSPFLLQLGSMRLPQGDGESSVYLGDTVLDMLTASFAERLATSTSVAPSTQKTVLLRQSQQFIEARLRDPALDVAAVAQGCHVSVRYLQKIYEEHGHTVSGWIRARRLDACRKDLASSELAHLPVGSLAARWGFTNATYFSRVFKSVHGVPPSVYREQILCCD
jgi:AraC-like DNA-binding protein